MLPSGVGLQSDRWIHGSERNDSRAQRSSWLALGGAGRRHSLSAAWELSSPAHCHDCLTKTDSHAFFATRRIVRKWLFFICANESGSFV